MADKPPTGEQKSIRAEVLQVIGGSGNPNIQIRIEPGFADFPLEYPTRSKVELKVDTKYPKNRETIKQMTRLLYGVLEMPIINYPAEPIDENIDRIDREILALFGTAEGKMNADKVLQQNRMRPNTFAQHTSTAIYLLDEVISGENLDDSKLIKRVFNALSPLIDVNNSEKKSLYKTMTTEEKVRVVKQYSKAAEITLRILNGDEIKKEDWKLLEDYRIDKLGD